MAGCEERYDSDRLGRVQSLMRAFSLLEAVAAHDEGVTLTEIARLAKLPRSTAHRLLTTMDALRYVEFDASTNRWMMGMRSFALGAAFVQTRDLGRLGRPIMRSLMLEANLTVNIAVSQDNGMRCVGQVRPLAAPAPTTKPGSTLPFYASASGKVLLAHAKDADLHEFMEGGPLRRRTATTIVDKSKLLNNFSSIREQGYAVDDQENEMGIRCVAAPVFDRHKRVSASLSITGPIAQLPDHRLDVLGRSLMAAANRMSCDISALLAA